MIVYHFFAEPIGYFSVDNFDRNQTDGAAV